MGDVVIYKANGFVPTENFRGLTPRNSAMFLSTGQNPVLIEFRQLDAEVPKHQYIVWCRPPRQLGAEISQQREPFCQLRNPRTLGLYRLFRLRRKLQSSARQKELSWPDILAITRSIIRSPLGPRRNRHQGKLIGDNKEAGSYARVSVPRLSATDGLIHAWYAMRFPLTGATGFAQIKTARNFRIRQF